MKHLITLLAIVALIGFAVPAMAVEITPHDIFENWEQVGIVHMSNGQAVVFYAKKDGPIQIAYLGGIVNGKRLALFEYGYLKNGKVVSFMLDREEKRMVPYEYPPNIQVFMVVEMTRRLKEFLYGNINKQAVRDIRWGR